MDFSCNSCFNYEIKYENGKNFLKYIFFLIFPLTIAFIITAIFDILNDEKIKENYENIIYNWNMKPIISIRLVNNTFESQNVLQWKNNFFLIEKMNNFDYINIYMNNEGKTCGKDNYGNDLYFPNDVECSINEIYFSETNKDIPGYTKIELNNGTF